MAAMDTLILNTGHSQLEEQLKIAAVVCGVSESSTNLESVDVEDCAADLSVEDVHDGHIRESSATASSPDHDISVESPLLSKHRFLGDEIVKTLEEISKQQAAQLAASTNGTNHPVQSGNYRSELKRPDLKGTFRCSICQKIFCHSSSLSRHRMQAHFKSYTCTLCRKEITRRRKIVVEEAKSNDFEQKFVLMLSVFECVETRKWKQH
uniref:C2H2-type domain-containing protein n=1 Tax=Syphacia muris TaxID=451379 RepID=A0A0N5AQ49_9BILA